MTAAVTFRRQCQTENEWDTFKGRMKKERGKSSLSLSLSLSLSEVCCQKVNVLTLSVP